MTPAEAGAAFRIEPPGNWAALNLREIWDYRELLYFLTWRDVKVRYKQTVLGALWAIIQPFFTMVIFSLFFGRLAKVPSDGLPYPVFAFTALVPWMFFASGMAQAANSVTSNTQLVTKVYFPRLVIPISGVLAGLVDFGLASGVLLVLMFSYGIVPTRQIVWLPLFVLFAFVTALGVGTWLSALNVKFRDVRYVVPFLTQLWMFATPVAYPSSLLGEPWRTIYGLNPMAGVIEGFRWALLGTELSAGRMIGISAAAALLLTAGGVCYFRRVESRFADIV